MWTAITHIDVIIFICRSTIAASLRSGMHHRVFCAQNIMNMNNRCVIIFITHQINTPLPANLYYASSTPTRKHITGCVAPRQALALNIWRQAVSKLTPLSYMYM